MKELQHSIIGSLIQDNTLYNRNKELLVNTSAFDDYEIKDIAAYVFDRLSNGEKVTLPLVLAKFKDKRQLIKSICKFCDPYSISAHIDRLITEYRRYEYVKFLRDEAQTLLEGKDPDESKIDIDKSIAKIDGNKAAKHLNWTQQIQKTLDNIILAREKKGLTGLTYCLSDLDKLTGGMQKTDLMILAARPGIGKTTYAIQLCESAQKETDGVVIFISLEMPASQIIEKFISIEAGITVNKMRTGNITDKELEKITQAADKVYNSKMVLIDYCYTIEEIKETCLNIAYKYKVDLLCVDYLQLVGSKSKYQNKNSLVEAVTREFKILGSSDRLNCPVLVLSQLNRSVETRADKRPMLSDLRDSGAIEQDADIIIFPYRPSYYDDSTLEYNELILSKNRHGSIGKSYFDFKYPYNRFTELNESTSAIEEETDQQILRVSRINTDENELQF